MNSTTRTARIENQIKPNPMAMKTLVAAKAAIGERIHKMNRLAFEAGVEINLNLISKNLERAFNHRLGFNKIWLSRDSKQIYELPLSELFGLVLKGTVIGDADDEAEQAQAS
jgi:hypothetical protein